MKVKVTKKAVRENYHKIVTIGYCDADALLSYENAFGYSAGVYGWCCDYYNIDGVCVCTGYSPIKEKNTKRDYKTIDAYNQKARKITYCGEAAKTAKRELLTALIAELSV